MTTALIIAIILAVCVVFALGVYHGQHHGREQCEDLAEREQLHEALDDLGEMYDQHVARQFVPAMQEAIADALVGDDTFVMLHNRNGGRS